MALPSALQSAGRIMPRRSLELAITVCHRGETLGRELDPLISCRLEIEIEMPTEIRVEDL